MDKVNDLIKKIFTKEVILYIIFGISTTIVNLGVFYILDSKLAWPENVANIIAIFTAVFFAYITNKDLVFHSKAVKLEEKIFEFIKFMMGRAFTMIVEFVGGWIMFKLPIPKMISKLIITAIVIILNFFISKFFAFKSNNSDKIEK